MLDFDLIRDRKQILETTKLVFPEKKEKVGESNFWHPSFIESQKDVSLHRLKSVASNRKPFSYYGSVLFLLELQNVAHIDKIHLLGIDCAFVEIRVASCLQKKDWTSFSPQRSVCLVPIPKALGVWTKNIIYLRKSFKLSTFSIDVDVDEWNKKIPCDCKNQKIAPLSSTSSTPIPQIPPSVKKDFLNNPKSQDLEKTKMTLEFAFCSRYIAIILKPRFNEKLYLNYESKNFTQDEFQEYMNAYSCSLEFVDIYGTTCSQLQMQNASDESKSKKRKKIIPIHGRRDDSICAQISKTNSNLTTT